MRTSTFRKITAFLGCFAVAGLLGYLVYWGATRESRNFQAEFNAPLPRTATERDVLRPRVVAKLTELSNTYSQAQEEYGLIWEGIRNVEGKTTPQAVMAQAGLRHKFRSVADKKESTYRRLHDACSAAFGTYYVEVDTLRCGPGVGFL